MYDIWKLNPRPLPPRSRLYSLPPMGIGTSRVESLTSYVMRLAEAHTVSVRALIRQEIFPNLPTSPKNTTFEKLHSLNGMGPCFEQWVKVLGRLTARRDLRSLTLLPWQTLLSSGGVLRRHRAWCPRCFEEWRHSAMPIYECLLWVLAPVMVCPIHEVLLERRCPHCHQRILPLSAHARPGFCTHCKRWLGEDVPASIPCERKQPTDEELRIAKEVGELLALRASVSDSSPRHLLSNLQRAISEFTNGNQRLFGRAAKIGGSLLKRWFKGDFFPSLPLVIRISHNFSLPLSRLVFEEVPSTDPAWIRAKQAVQASFPGRRRTFRPQYPITCVVRLSRLPPRERESAKAELKACLQVNLERDEPRPVEEVFRHCGCSSPSRGRTWFPDLCAATKKKRQQRVETYRQELLVALTEEPPPTVVQVAQRLGVRITQLRLRRGCRELCKALYARYPERRRFEKTRTEEALRRALEDPPVPLVTLAARLHKDPNGLRVAFPDLCRRLRDRYLASRCLEQQRVRLLYEIAVRQAIIEITDAGAYPSQQRVLAFISKRNPSLTSFYLTGLAIKTLRKELDPAF